MSAFPDSSGTSDPAASSNGVVIPSSVPLVQEPTRSRDESSMMSPLESSPFTGQRMGFETSDDEGDQDEDDVDSLITDESSIVDDENTRNVPRGLPTAKLPTGLCYDERMRYHSEVSATNGDNVHPEDPRRIYYIFKELVQAGLVADGDKSKLFVDPPLYRIDAREATRRECCLIHTPEHYDFVKRTAEMTDEELIDLSEDPRMDSIYFNALSYYAGKLSAGGAIETCRAVMSRKVKNAIAVIRPPGHHAEVHSTMGFCLFNNVCIASRVCQEDFGEVCRKILILDWDVHHGNGCQKAFYDDPNILYISLHVHMNGMFYPSGNEGDMYHCGKGVGLGKNVNVPWPTKGMGDGDYMYAFQNVVMPIATEFNPDFVIVAAGFDAAAGDELGGCFVTPACYAHMTHMLMSLANGKIAVCLEGGYNFAAISKSALAVTRTLMGEPPDRLPATAATQAAIDTVQKVRHVQSRYWRSVYPKDSVEGIYGGERLHDLIRAWQALHLYDKYRLTQLHIFRDNISKSFENQVLASSGYETKKNLLVIFHDPPDLLGPGGALSNVQKPHETWMVDGVQSYIEWAIDHNFGVIDVNIPEKITPAESAGPAYHNITAESTNSSQDQSRVEGEKLAVYLWENYIEPYDFEGGVFLMGAGHAFHAIAKLVGDSENVYLSLLGIIAFIAANPVRPVNSPNHPAIGQWYSSNSQVIVSSSHGLWKKDKLSKRYGHLIKSESSILNEMMELHADQVIAWMTQRAALDEVSEVEEMLDGHNEETKERQSTAALDAVLLNNANVGDDVVMSMEM